MRYWESQSQVTTKLWPRASALVILIIIAYKFTFLKCAEAVAILSSTVIECYKSELKGTALTACFTVMKPEFRPRLRPEFGEKFEYILRKYGKGDTDDLDDLISACPNCNTNLPNYDLYCRKCNTEIPFCVMSVSF